MKFIFFVLRKFSFILWRFIIVSFSRQPKKNEKLIRSLIDEKIKRRGNLIEISKSEFRLDYYDIDEKDSHLRFLESRGYQAGGYSWSGIVFGAIKMSDPKLMDKIRFDGEADGLAIWSSDKSSLKKIGRLISTVKSDDLILMQTIKVAKKNWQME